MHTNELLTGVGFFFFRKMCINAHNWIGKTILFFRKIHPHAKQKHQNQISNKFR